MGEQPAGRGVTNTVRMLVVEDEERLVALLRRGLAEEGYAVDLTGSGEEALDWVAVAAYDAIVLDVRLPGGFLDLVWFVPPADEGLRTKDLVICDFAWWISASSTAT